MSAPAPLTVKVPVADAKAAAPGTPTAPTSSVDHGAGSPGSTTAGPEETTSVTMDAGVTLVPPTGDCVDTAPLATVGLVAVVTAPTVSPAALIAEAAAACVSPTTAG